MLRGMEYVKVGDGTSAEADLRLRSKKIKKIMKYIWPYMKLWFPRIKPKMQKLC